MRLLRDGVGGKKKKRKKKKQRYWFWDAQETTSTTTRPSMTSQIVRTKLESRSVYQIDRCGALGLCIFSPNFLDRIS